MKTAEEKFEMLRRQVNSKVSWGARDCEVLDWLREDHGITDSTADDLLTAAHRRKRAAVRIKALWHLVFSIFGMLFAGAFIVLQRMGHFVIIGYGSILIIALGIVCVRVFIRSLSQLITGYTEGSVD